MNLGSSGLGFIHFKNQTVMKKSDLLAKLEERHKDSYRSIEDRIIGEFILALYKHLLAYFPQESITAFDIHSCLVLTEVEKEFCADIIHAS